MKNGQGNVKSLEISTDWQLREVISGCVLCHKTAFFLFIDLRRKPKGHQDSSQALIVLRFFVVLSMSLCNNGQLDS